MIAPPGYVALGDVISVGYDSPTNLSKKYACIKSDYVVQGCFAYEIWGDNGSGASQDGSMWAVTPTTNGVAGHMKVQSGYSMPSSVYAQCLNGVSVTV